MPTQGDALTRDMRENAVVRYDLDAGYLQVEWRGVAIGGKVQTHGPRCKWWERHDWFIDEYESPSQRNQQPMRPWRLRPTKAHIARDKVCRKCKRRRPLN